MIQAFAVNERGMAMTASALKLRAPGMTALAVNEPVWVLRRTADALNELAFVWARTAFAVNEPV